jgi:hypothetical protein
VFSAWSGSAETDMWGGWEVFENIVLQNSFTQRKTTRGRRKWRKPNDKIPFVRSYYNNVIQGHLVWSAMQHAWEDQKRTL